VVNGEHTRAKDLDRLAELTKRLAELGAEAKELSSEQATLLRRLRGYTRHTRIC
jgi:5-enolpyruvylshikimate-3-phosphate synthase